MIAIIFGVVLIYSAIAGMRENPDGARDAGPDRIATWLHMDSTYPTPAGKQKYHVRGVPLGFRNICLAPVFIGVARNWLRGRKSFSYGSGDEVAVQGFDHHQ